MEKRKSALMEASDIIFAHKKHFSDEDYLRLMDLWKVGYNTKDTDTEVQEVESIYSSSEESEESLELVTQDDDGLKLSTGCGCTITRHHEFDYTLGIEENIDKYPKYSGRDEYMCAINVLLATLQFGFRPFTCMEAIAYDLACGVSAGLRFYPLAMKERFDSRSEAIRLLRAIDTVRTSIHFDEIAAEMTSSYNALMRCLYFTECKNVSSCPFTHDVFDYSLGIQSNANEMLVYHPDDIVADIDTISNWNTKDVNKDCRAAITYELCCRVIQLTECYPEAAGEAMEDTERRGKIACALKQIEGHEIYKELWDRMKDIVTV